MPLKISIILLVLCLFNCKENTKTPSDLEMLRNSQNTTAYPARQLDSAEVIRSITHQKLQEVMDLSSVYLSGKRNTKIDSAILEQLHSYFLHSDSLSLKTLFREMDSLKVKSAKISDVSIQKVVHKTKKDSISIAKFNVVYRDKSGNSFGAFPRESTYTLVSAPVRFQKEFKFYFLDFFKKPDLSKDSLKVTK